MDLASMLQREDFFPLFFATVKKYYKEVFGQDVEIDFAEKKDCNLVIKPVLSAATAPRMSPAARGFFYSEWNVRNSLFKYLAAKAGVTFLTHSGKAVSQFCFRMTPEKAVTKDLVIAPNNRSIRFFDYESKMVGCMIKDGFTSKYFCNQLEFRKSHSYPFMLPMLKWGGDWFVEPILNGHPLVRVTKETMYQKGISDALAGIRMLAEDTLSQVEAEAYVSKMLARIEDLLIDAEKRKKIRTAASTRKLAENAEKKVIGTLQIIPLCGSHGDFQTGNIWVDENGKTWIYDWETAGRRSVWYDSAVLCYSLRRPYGWGELATQTEPSKLLHCDTKKDYSQSEYAAIKAVVLLEDILFYLEDMLELPKDWGAEIFDAFIERVEKVTIFDAEVDKWQN